MSAHVLLSLLVFEHGFIQIRFGSFEFFTRYLFIKFYAISFLWDLFTISFTIFYWWMLDTQVKVFHESISYFMKWSWNCISWNALKETFRSVSFPLVLRPWRQNIAQDWCTCQNKATRCLIAIYTIH